MKRPAQREDDVKAEPRRKAWKGFFAHGPQKEPTVLTD